MQSQWLSASVIRGPGRVGHLGPCELDGRCVGAVVGKRLPVAHDPEQRGGRHALAVAPRLLASHALWHRIQLQQRLGLA